MIYVSDVRRALRCALVVAVVVVAAGCDFGPTSTPLDAEGVREVVKEWTGASLPERITVVKAQRTDAFMDPSMSAVFDAARAGVEGFVAGLGERRISELAADCRYLPGPVTFTEIPDSVRVFDPQPQSWIPEYQGTFKGDYLVTKSVEAGDLERCRNITTVSARPTSPYVDVLIQARDDGTSRVALMVIYT